MAKRATSTQQFDQSSSRPDFVTVILPSTFAPARVPVPAGAAVKHLVASRDGRYFIIVSIDGVFVGFHAGSRTGLPVFFSRESDADRLCKVRNATWRAVRRSVKAVA